MKQYYETREVAEILGCSASQARQIMMSMPHLRITQGKGSKVRIKIEDFQKYITEHTVQPDELQPRSTPFRTIDQMTKDWHKGRKIR